MKRFNFEPTSYCNLRCILCPSIKFSRERQGFMDFGKFEKIINQSFERGVIQEGDEVHLYGFGEPTLHPLLPEMVGLLNSLKIFSKINTNGQKLIPRVWNALTLNGLSSCLISIDGLDQNTYQKYRQGGILMDLLKNIEYACKNPRKTKIELQFIAFKHNLDQMEEFLKYAKNVGAHISTIKKPRVWTASPEDYEGLKDLPLRFKRIKTNRPCKFIEDYGLVLQNGLLTLCTADAFGDYAIGNLFDKGPELWYSEEFLKLRRDAKVNRIALCNQCYYADAYLEKRVLIS